MYIFIHCSFINPRLVFFINRVLTALFFCCI
nr:MAG TPA: TMCO5 family [Caudoviricetes sp.]